jgi:heme exporter protein D
MVPISVEHRRIVIRLKAGMAVKFGSSHCFSKERSAKIATGFFNLGDWALYALAVKIGIIAGLVIYWPLFLQRQAVLREVTTPS